MIDGTHVRAYAYRACQVRIVERGPRDAAKVQRWTLPDISRLPLASRCSAAEDSGKAFAIRNEGLLTAHESAREALYRAAETTS